MVASGCILSKGLPLREQHKLPPRVRIESLLSLGKRLIDLSEQR